MLLVGLTGGIASGKSVVAERLEQLGAAHIDADVVARDVVQPGTPALARIAEEFGSAVLNADGSLDRAALASIVFADDERREALNAIVHPAVHERVDQLVAEAASRDPEAVVVYNVPLLTEVPRRRPFDLVVVVHASERTRMQRLMDHRGLSQAEAQQRIAAQATDDERLAIADVVIDNDGELTDTMAAVDSLWRDLAGRARAARA